MSRSPAFLAFLVAGAFFMEFLDGTVIATAVPAMARSFDVRAADLGIGISAYLLTLAVLLPISGWVADRYGARTVFTAALGTFTFASALCALTTSLDGFVMARVLQGAGGAMMVPVGRLVVLRATAKEDLVKAIATLTWPALTAPIIAPPLGGFITSFASWRWIFLINLPVGLCGMVFALLLMPNRAGDRHRRLDWVGFVLTGLSCLLVMLAIEGLGGGPSALPVPLASAGGALLLVASVVWLRRHPAPLLDLGTLRIPTFRVSVLGGSLFRIAISTVPFLLPLMFQIGFGYDAFHSGLLVLAVFVGNMGIKPVTTPILRRFGFRTVMIGNGALAALMVASCAILTPATPLGVTVAVLALGGVARSIQLTAINTVAFADVPQERMSGANTLFNMVQQISLGLGVAVGVCALRFAQIWRPAGIDAPTVGEFHIAFLVASGIAVLATLDALTLRSDAGLTVSRGRA